MAWFIIVLYEQMIFIMPYSMDFAHAKEKSFYIFALFVKILTGEFVHQNTKRELLQFKI